MGRAEDSFAIARILADHDTWVRTGGRHGREFKEGVHARFPRSLEPGDLTGFRGFQFRDLSHQVLRHVTLDDADLTGLVMVGGLLGPLRLHRARVRQASFDNCWLTDLDAREADFTGTNLMRVDEAERCDFTGATFDECRFTGVQFEECRLADCSWRGAVFEQCWFTDVDLAGVRFDGLTGTLRPQERARFWWGQHGQEVFEHINSHGGQVTWAPRPELPLEERDAADKRRRDNIATLAGVLDDDRLWHATRGERGRRFDEAMCDFSDEAYDRDGFIDVAGCTTFRGQQLGDQFVLCLSLDDADLTGLVCEGVFASVHAHRATIRDAYFRKTDVNEVDARGADFSGTTFKGTSLHDCDFRDARFDHCRLVGEMWERCLLHGTSWVGAELVNCTFEEVDLTGVCFDGLTGTLMPPFSTFDAWWTRHAQEVFDHINSTGGQVTWESQ